MLNHHQYQFGHFTFSYSTTGAITLPNVPSRLEPFQIYTDCPVDFQFLVQREMPLDLEKSRQERFRSRNWVLYDFDQAPLFEKIYPAFPDFRLYVHFNSNNSSGKIYYKENSISWFYPFDDFIFIDLLSCRSAGYIHAAGVAWKNKAFLFTGFSGVGKSTLAKLLQALPGVELLSDERIMLVQENSAIWAYGTPWFSTLPTTSSKGAPLEAIYFLRHGTQNKVTSVKPLTTTALIFQQFYPANWDMEKLQSNLQLIETVARTTPAYNLDFLPDVSAVDFLERIWNE